MAWEGARIAWDGAAPAGAAVMPKPVSATTTATIVLLKGILLTHSREGLRGVSLISPKAAL